MTSNELKHQAKVQEWGLAIQDCRSSGVSVREWCRPIASAPQSNSSAASGSSFRKRRLIPPRIAPKRCILTSTGQPGRKAGCRTGLYRKNLPERRLRPGRLEPLMPSIGRGPVRCCRSSGAVAVSSYVSFFPHAGD